VGVRVGFVCRIRSTGLGSDNRCAKQRGDPDIPVIAGLDLLEFTGIRMGKKTLKTSFTGVFFYFDGIQ
jgi:hypothetical protein